MGHVATPLPVQGEAQAASVPQAGSVYLCFQTPGCLLIPYAIMYYGICCSLTFLKVTKSWESLCVSWAWGKFRDKCCFWTYLKCILGAVSGAGIGTESTETLCTKQHGMMTRPAAWPENRGSRGCSSVQD